MMNNLVLLNSSEILVSMCIKCCFVMTICWKGEQELCLFLISSFEYFFDLILSFEQRFLHSENGKCLLL